MRGESAAGARAGRRRSPGDEAVYAAVYEAILDHRLPPGTRLGEDSLGDIFGVSRTVVRKALIRLAEDNIVRLRPNRGAAVASPSVAEAREVFEARRVVESAVVRRLAGAADRGQLDSLRAMVRSERAAFESGDRRGWIRLSGDFHVELARIAGNAVLADFLKELVSRTSLIIALYQSRGSAACAFTDHMGLLDAIARGDEARASVLMRDHLLECENKLNLSGDEHPVDLGEVFAPDAGRRALGAGS